MRDIPQHATLQQMDDASRALDDAARRMKVAPIPEGMPWPERVAYIKRRMASLCFTYLVMDNKAALAGAAAPISTPPTWRETLKNWLSALMRWIP